MPAIGCFCEGELDRTGFGLSKAPAWDPFYLVDRTVQSLFLAGVCFLYLSQGVIHAGIGTFFLLNLRERVKRHGLILSYAMQAALAEATTAKPATQAGNGNRDGGSDARADSAVSDGVARAEEGKGAVAIDARSAAGLPPPAKLPTPSGGQGAAGQQPWRPRGSRASAVHVVGTAREDMTVWQARETVALEVRGATMRAPGSARVTGGPLCVPCQVTFPSARA